MAETLTGATIASTYKTLLKAGSNNPVALASGSGDSERLVFGEDDAADVRTALYVTQDRLGIGTEAPLADLDVAHATDPRIRLTRADATVTTDEVLGSIQFATSDPSAGAVGASIQVKATSAWASKDYP